MSGFIIFLGLIILVSILLYHQASMAVWLVSVVLVLLLLGKFVLPWAGTLVLASTALCVFILLGVKPLRLAWLSRPLLALFVRQMPSMSTTEREALEAGTVSWEGDLFSGRPDLDKLLAQPSFQLSDEEQAFLQGPVDALCSVVDVWQATHVLADLPKEAWELIKKHRFFAMIIPKEYGGLGFSASGQAAVLSKLYGKSVSLGATVSVPNSLGPAELLLHYGTTEQKNYYLPRLASGEEIPCFALTSPIAGSDAASIEDQGIVCRGDYKGNTVVGIKLNWDKRYITLSPIATVIGLAFHLYDPEHLLGEQEDIGITCALIPVNTPGVVTGRRHFPLNAVFLNGPTQGHDVFIPVDAMIGGVKYAGQGWRMLMACLAAGRAISLPSGAVGGCKMAALVCGAYGRIRQQFNLPIGYFEGVEEPLARIAASAYITESALQFTAAAIDQGEKPPVASAIVKYHTTELARQAALDAMDIHGGKGICLGPKNYLGRSYQAAPIMITVEGANILTRSLIIFGQGAIRCHPYLYTLMTAARDKQLPLFDKTLLAYVNHMASTKVRSFWLSLTGSWLSATPKSKARRFYQGLLRYSSALALCTEFCIIAVGANLKRREKLSARLGDMLSHLYLLSALLKRYHDDNEPEEDWPLLQWCGDYLLYQCQQACHGVISNFPHRWLAVSLKILLFPWGYWCKPPSDHLGHLCARLLLSLTPTQCRLIAGLYTAAQDNNPPGLLAQALPIVIASEPLEKRLREAVKLGKCQATTYLQQIHEAQLLGIFSESEAKQLQEAYHLRMLLTSVDDFDDAALKKE